ncbi:uncharacterized protein M6B38_379320 [Iris pallida]|uniref:Uncharacterized protein n=1 Tax=Iris pallida TaxID=29817 RepID=A0AAX6G8J8_IRIPA|nr:uncharacterized protein M6B38_379320 [Iris pallida]
MKLNTESPYHHTYPNEHAAKVIVHNDDHFILPRDNHFTTDILAIGNGTLKEGNHGVKYPNENESCNVTLTPQPHGIANMEDYKIRNMNGYDCVGNPYSAPYSEIGLVVKEDFYANKAVAKAELPEKIVCMNDRSCHIVKNLSVAEEVHSFQNNSAEKEDVGQKVPLCSNNSSKNENNDIAEEMEGTTGSHDFEYELIERDSSTIIDRKPEDPTSVNKSVEDFSCLSSIEVGDKLDTAEWVATTVSCRRLENLSIAEEVHYFQNSLAEEEVGQKALFHSNNSLNNDNDDVANKIKHIASSHGFERAVIEKDSITTMDRNPADPTSIDKSVEKISCVSSTESGYKLYTAEWVSNVSEDGDALDRNESTTYNILDEIIGKQLPPDDLNKESLKEYLSVLSCSDDQKHSTDGPKIDQAILERSKTTSTTVLSAAEDVDRDKEISSTCKVPSGVITFTFDPKEASTSSREVNKDDKDVQQSTHHIGPGTEGATSDGATTSTRSSFLHLIQEDSNFHGPGFLSGSIANSGHIPYSGNISIRSDSSTTSARSFAFPILQSEWNSSPVKMAKARRRGRKLFCCRF